MQHLERTHGVVSMSVPLVDGRDVYRRRHASEGLDDCTFKKFHEFPRSRGWSILDDYRLHPVTPQRLNFWSFLQSWLFFGLIYTIVQEDQQPILSYEALSHQTSSLSHVTTENLNEALDRWHRHVLGLSERDPDAARILMVRVQEVLKLAKKVVCRNLALVDGDTKPFYTTCGFSGPRKRAEGPLSLSFMILGETLSARTSAIIRGCKLQISGWLDDMTNDGWGPSGHLLQEMKASHWCPRTIELLRSQLHSHATLMMAAFLSHKDTAQAREHAEHIKVKDSKKKPCSETECTFKSEMLGSGTYTTKHTLDCDDHDECKNRGKKGPDMGQILDILSRSEIPTVSLTMVNEGDFEFSVESHPRRLRDSDDTIAAEVPKYATISHVWADGWGNEDSNELYHCQLVFLHQLLRSGLGLSGLATNQISFWMDTLVIPVVKDPTVRTAMQERNISNDRLKHLKKEAISQIHDVFYDSEFTVVIDNALYGKESDDIPCQTAMMILVSGWMKRLWTLQEAFLSRRIYIALGGGVGEVTPLKDFDDLVDRGLRCDSNVADPFPLLTKRHLTESLIHSHRYRAVDQQRRPMSRGRAQPAEETRTPNQLEAAMKGYTLITDAWRAARWRTTSNPAHETLALATLLNLDYSRTDIAAAGLTQPSQDTDNKKEILEADKRVMEFWDLFHRERPGSIPAGLIFLPGTRVAIKGYGWAPRSFLDAFQAQMGHLEPFPAAEPRTFFPTRIHREWGLHVRYPGFLLHCKNGKSVREIIRAKGTAKEPSLIFPANGSFLEWYSVRPVESVLPNNSALETIMNRRTQIAIILTRPIPRNLLAEEIGLLVEIYHPDDTPRYDRTSPWSYCCQIVRRVFVKRDLSSSQPRNIPVLDPSAVVESGNEGTDAITRTPVVNGHSIYGPNAPPQLQLMPDSLRPQIIADGSEDDICIAEALETSQEWYVDSFHGSRDKGLPTFRAAIQHVAPPRLFLGFTFSRFGMISSNSTTQSNSDSQLIASTPSPSPARVLPRTNTSMSAVTASQAPAPGVKRAGTLSSLKSFFSSQQSE